MKRNIFAVITLVVCVTMLSGCGAASLNTDENAALFAQSALAGFEHEMDAPIYESVKGSWLAVRAEHDETGNIVWRVVGCSEQSLSEDTLASIQTLIQCRSQTVTNTYKSTTSSATVEYSSEKVTVTYYDVASGGCYGTDVIYKELPEKTTRTLHYTVSNRDILAAIQKRIASIVCPCHPSDFFEINRKGVLRDVHGYNQSLLVFPDTVTEIGDGIALDFGIFRGWNKLKTAYIPDSVIKIPPKTFPGGVVLVVGEGSYAEQYAIENDLSYRYRTGETIFEPENPWRFEGGRWVQDE